MTHESSKCLANPSKVFYTALKGSNPEALIDCSCSLINKESYLLLGINETGVFVKQRSFP